MSGNDSHDENWRLRADVHGLDGHEHHEHLDRLIKHLRADSSGLAGDLRDQVVLTHDGNTLFGYALTQTALQSTASAIEVQLASAGEAAAITLAHWNEATREWQELDRSVQPVEGGEGEGEGEGEGRGESDVDVDARGDSAGLTDGAAERTFVVVVGKSERNAFEWDIVNYINARGLSYRIVEHPHLLTSQVAFHVSGSTDELNELDGYIKREARRTIRIDPGSIPYGGV